MADSRRRRHDLQSFQRPADDRGRVWASLPRKRSERDHDDRTSAFNDYSYSYTYTYPATSNSNRHSHPYTDSSSAHAVTNSHT
jgi:hypothetical protein